VKPLVTDRNVAGSHCFVGEHDQFPFDELHAVSEFADPDFRTPGIEHDGRPGAQPLPGSFDGFDKVAVTFLVAVR